MTISLKKFNRLKQRVSDLQAASDKAKGALQQVLGRLQSSHGCKSIEEAETKLAKQKKKVKSLEMEYSKELEAFEKEWADDLNDKPKKKS